MGSKTEWSKACLPFQGQWELLGFTSGSESVAHDSSLDDLKLSVVVTWTLRSRWGNWVTV